MTTDREAARDHVLRYGRDTVAFQGLGSGFRHWFDADTDACVAYVDTGGTWVAAGGPLCALAQRARAAERFAAAARATGRSACFFGVEHPAELGGDFAAALLGEQAEIDPARWAQTLARHRHPDIRCGAPRHRTGTARCVCRPSRWRL